MLQSFLTIKMIYSVIQHCKWCFDYQINPKSQFHVAEIVFVVQSCPTLCDPMDCSQSGFSIRGILQTRILVWVAFPFSRRSALQKDSSPSEPPGKQVCHSKKERKKECHYESQLFQYWLKKKKKGTRKQ